MIFPRRPGVWFRAIGAAAFALLLGAIAPTTAPAQFTPISSGVNAVHHGSAIWGNYNNDALIDLFVSGWMLNNTFFSDVYKNNGGTFAAIGTGIPGVAAGAGRCRSAWGDFDGDGDIDLIVTGQQIGFSSIANLYSNPGTAPFPQMSVLPTPFPGLALSSVAWGDFDNDGDLDLFVEGTTSGVPNITTIYRNDGPSGGSWIFTNINAALTQVAWGDGAWGDYDNDGDMDLVVTGFYMNGGGPITTLYRNDGGVFVNSGVTNLPAAGRSSVAWGDYDNDGYLDLAIGGDGINGFGPPILEVYHNNGNGTFSFTTAIPGGIEDGSIAWGDYNNDGNFDLLITGNDGQFPPTPVADVYAGNGAGTFTPLAAGLTGVGESQATWGDYDNDGRLDILLAGKPVSATSFTDIYQNTSGVASDQPPTSPTGLVATAQSWHSVTVSWNPSTDAESPQPTLTYNLSVRDGITGHFVMPPMADLATGRRWVPALGNTDHNTSWTVTGLQPNHPYQICVQAIDQAFVGSKFNCGLKVTTDKGGPDVMIHDCLADVGAEPNLACATYYQSTDIYVRNQPDGFVNTTHQSPLSGQTNYVYVNLENIGSANMSTGTVYVYFAKASTGLSWSQNWVNNYIGAIPYGDVVGSSPVTNLAAGASTTVEIPWNNVPDPSDYSDPDAHHFCLLARFVSASDPMTFLEGTSTPVNTQNNNNIAWKNVSIIDTDGPQAPLDVNNVEAVPAVTALQFQVPQNELDDNILNHGKIKVDLGAKMYDLWVAGGRQGMGIQVEDVPGSTSLWITSTRAGIRNITLAANERLTIHVRIEYPKDIPEDILGRVYHWNVEQYTEGKKGVTMIGGEAYDIHMGRVDVGGGDKDPKRAIPDRGGDLGGMLQLGAHPNPASLGTTISFTLPVASRASLAIHDAGGRLVRTLLSDADRSAGAQDVVWDGAGSDGKAVPSGVYFYRLSTPQGAAERQIRIVR